MLKGSPIATLSSTNPKSLVMLDAAGKVATLKLTTNTGLHVYDGQMLWVNPAQTVTAAAPKSGGTGSQPLPGLQRTSKALPIVDPNTNEELVVKKPEATAPAPTVNAAPPTRPPPPPTFTTPLAPLLSVASPSAPPSVPTVPPMLVHPSSTPIFTQPAPSPPAPSQPQKEQNIIDLLAKATKQSPSTLLAMTRGRRELDRDRGKGRKGATRTVQAEGKGKGRGARAVVNNDPRRRVETTKFPGEKYTKDAKFTASLDGRFWSLSSWPTGERDQEHRLTFGKHKLEVLEDGVVKVVLFGGVNKYKVRLHLSIEEDDLGANDKDGWELATCEPSAANLQLSDEAEKLGWKILIVGDHPLLYPPGVPLPEAGSKEQTPSDAERPVEAPEEGADAKPQS
eukprot:GGOE01021169.1.p1 GENE.GGOE01021169.1~~GGOE01021169.1.p1  ORF type:complete len:412 (+),score=38.21 GGOE01021169.1:54-1238(+)